MNAKKIMAIGMAAAMLVGATGCGSTASTTSTTSSGDSTAAASSEATASTDESTASAHVNEDGKTVLNIGWGYAITSLSPYQAESPAKTLFYCTNTYETLARYDNDGVLQPVLAKEWKQLDDDGYEWEVTIFDYIHDSAGNAITADDVIYSIGLINASGNLNSYYTKLDGVDKVDDYTLDFHMNSNEYGDFEMLLQYCLVVSQAAYEASGDEMATSLTCTGPYVVTDFVNSSTVTFEKNEDYWQTDDSLKGPYADANIDILQISCITEESQQEIALETGTIDYMQGGAAHSIDQLASYTNIDHEICSTSNMYYFYFSAEGALANENLRKAVSYAIDADAVNEAAYESSMAPCNFGSSMYGDYVSSWDDQDYYSYDVDKARELIAQEGAEGTHIRILATGTGVTMDEVIQAYLIDAGFDCELVEEELATYLTDATDPTAYDIICITPSAFSNIGMWKIMLDQRSWGGTTVNGFVDDTLQDLILKASSIEGHTDENMDALYQYAVDKDYVYCTFCSSSIDFWNSDVVSGNATMYGGVPYLNGLTLK